jgi:death-on-curing protein
MITLTIDQVLALHDMMLQATGGATGLRDRGALESAIYHAFASFDGNDLYPTTEEKAARQAYAMIRNHPFVDGNKRVGLLVMLVFLELNAIVLRFSQEELIDLGFSVAAGNRDDKAVLEWIQQHKS